MATVIDTLFLELGIDASRFGSQAAQTENRLNRMGGAFSQTEQRAGAMGRSLDRTAAQAGRSARQARTAAEAFAMLGKRFAAFAALVMGQNALDRLIRQTAEANVQLDNLSRNIGMNRNQLQAWGGMAAVAGGSADAMKGSLAGLSMSITRLTTMGDTSMVPFFNAFGVALLNADGKARDLDGIMLDLADRFSKMDRVQAYNLAKSMGLDDGTINTLLLGRAEMEKMLALQNRLYRSGEKEIAVGRELTRSRAYLNQQWDALKNMIADALAPHLLNLVKLVSGFADYLMRNENTMRHVFEGLAFVLGVVLIPVLWSAVTALYAFIAPFALAAAAVAALGAAFVLLYDDYKTWAKGGKSLFNWGSFVNYIKTSKVSVDSLSKGFAYLLTGYTSWAEAGKGMFDWLRMKGFIDENGVSLRSLANGFKNLANDIYQFVAPALEDIGEIFTALMDGDFDRAWTAAKRLAMRPVNFIQEQAQNLAERVSGAADHATGHTPGAQTAGRPILIDMQTVDMITKRKTVPKADQPSPSGQTTGNDPKAEGSPKSQAQKGKETIKQPIDTQQMETRPIKGEVRLTEQDIIDIKKVAATEVVGSLKGEAFDKQLAGVVDTILNRVYKKGGNVRAVLNERWAFSDINAPRKGAYGSVQNVPMSRVSARISKGVDDHLAKRASGMASVVGGNTHYANPYFLREASARTRRWVREVERQANATGQRFGAGKAVHVHGTPSGSTPAPAFRVVLTKNTPIAGTAVAAGAQRGLQSMRQGEAVRTAQNVTNNNQRTTQVAINGGIHVQSSANTIDGTMADASAAARNRLVQIMPSMV